jgi:hypothetical protein
MAIRQRDIATSSGRLFLTLYWTVRQRYIATSSERFLNVVSYVNFATSTQRRKLTLNLRRCFDSRRRTGDNTKLRLIHISPNHEMWIIATIQINWFANNPHFLGQRLLEKDVETT